MNHSNLCLSIAVKDTSVTGGGILAVALPLHNIFPKIGVNSTLISEGQCFTPVSNAYVTRAFGLSTLFLSKKRLGDLIHIHGTWNLFELFCFLAGKAKGLKLVISPHGALEPWAFKSKHTKKKLAWWLYQKRLLSKADLVIVNSEQERDNLVDLGIKTQVAVIPNGVTLDGYEVAVEQHKNKERDRTVLYFSRIDRKKGIDLLIKAWANLSDKLGFKLKIQGYGDEEYLRELTDLSKSLNVQDSVIFEEAVFGKDKWNSFHSASIYVLPSYSENFGITVAEALFSGLPCITTKEMPWHDLPDNNAGWSVEANVDAIEMALKDAINLEEPKLITMRQNAVEYAQNRFLWDNIVHQYKDTYQWLLDKDGSERPNFVSK